MDDCAASTSLARMASASSADPESPSFISLSDFASDSAS